MSQPGRYMRFGWGRKVSKIQTRQAREKKLNCCRMRICDRRVGEKRGSDARLVSQFE